MNWTCDVYVYESTYGGFVTHVAARRRVIPPIPDISMHLWRLGHKATLLSPLLSSAGSFWHNRIHMGSLKIIPLRPIGLPHDGANFCDETPNECVRRLEYLRAVGYNVPQYAIDALLEEAKE